MDEARLRQQVCQAAYQLWARGLISGGSGLVSVELHRRRFLVTPHHARRPNLTPEDIITVDMGGLNIQGGSGIPEPLWKTHRAAYKATLGGELAATATPASAPASGAGGGSGGARPRPRLISAVVLADAPILLAIMRLLPHADRAEFAGMDAVPIVEGRDDREIAEALLRSPGVLVRGIGAVVAGDHLAAVLNWLERLDAAARAELAAGGNGAPHPPRQLDPPEPPETPEPPEAPEPRVDQETEPAETHD